MKNQFAIAVVTALSAASLPAAAAGFERPVSEQAVAACVDDVNRAADFGDAASVRYEIVPEQRRSGGHDLRVLTLVVDTDGNVQRFRATCRTSRNGDLLATAMVAGR